MSQRDNDPQQVLVAIDRETRHAAIYHVDATNGTMTLRSTRNLAWHLLVDDFNGREPSPQALKNMLETGTTPAESPRPDKSAKSSRPAVRAVRKIVVRVGTIRL